VTSYYNTTNAVIFRKRVSSYCGW